MKKILITGCLGIRIFMAAGQVKPVTASNVSTAADQIKTNHTVPVDTITRPDGHGVVAMRFVGFYNRRQADSIFKMSSQAFQKILTPAVTVQMLMQLHTQFGDLKTIDPILINPESGLSRYKAGFEKATVMMNLVLDKDGLMSGISFVPYRPPMSATDSAESRTNIFLTTASGKIYGTLAFPTKDQMAGSQRVPVVLIIAGSGATDRNGNSGPGVNAFSYKMLADSLQRYGIASLRYDKRSIGESRMGMQPESSLRFEDFVGDAAGFIRMLRADGRFSRVIVLGHSEGSLIGMIAAAQEGADGYISLAGSGQRADQLLLRQLSAQSPEIALRAASLLDSLHRGFTVKNPGGDLDGLFRASVQPYLISWMHYDPAVEIKKLGMPVLILQGTNDLQIDMLDPGRLDAQNLRLCCG